MLSLRFAVRLPRASMIPRKAILLNPFAPEVLSAADRETVRGHGISVIDCSWERATEVFQHRPRAQNRRLPLLLAGNPTNYSKLGKLSSAEALAGGLYVAGFREQAAAILGEFSWGETFLTLNHDPLEDYANARNAMEVLRVEREYFSDHAHATAQR